MSELSAEAINEIVHRRALGQSIRGIARSMCLISARRRPGFDRARWRSRAGFAAPRPSPATPSAGEHDRCLRRGHRRIDQTVSRHHHHTPAGRAAGPGLSGRILGPARTGKNPAGHCSRAADPAFRDRPRNPSPSGLDDVHDQLFGGGATPGQSL